MCGVCACAVWVYMCVVTGFMCVYMCVMYAHVVCVHMCGYAGLCITCGGQR